MELFHASHEEISNINASGVFGGIFATGDAGAALSHADQLFRVSPQNPLDDFTLNYGIENAWEVALEVSGGNEAVAEAIMSKGCETLEDCDPEDAAEQGWELQRLRGLLAARLGYDAIEMEDEHGITWLCLPGCKVERV